MSEDKYTKEKLIWVTHRLDILDEVDKKLQEMKRISEYALNSDLQEGERNELNRNIIKLSKEVEVLYEKDKNFYLEWQ